MENNRFLPEMTFEKSITRMPMKVSLQCGWINIDNTIEAPTFFDPKNTKVVNTSMTTEDARHLIEALTKMLEAYDKQHEGKSL